MSLFSNPTDMTYSPFTSTSSIVVEDIITPITPIFPYAAKTTFSNIPKVNLIGYNPNYNIGYTTAISYPSVYATVNPKTMFYYDSGIGENPIAQHDTNVDLRYLFLDKWLFNEDNQSILKMLKVDGNNVRVLSKSESERNDISKDTESDLEKKSDFIGSEILTLGKNRKILDAICRKNNLKYYDLHSNKKYVQRAQVKYVKSKLEEMQK